MKLVSRKEAKAAGLKRYFTGKSCKHGHVAERWVSSWECGACDRAGGVSHYARNSERVRARKADYRARNIEQVRASGAAYRARNPEKVRAGTAAWVKANPGRANAHTARRYAHKLKATPVWADQDAITEFYKDAARRQMTVDHIVPLQGRLVCGLHVHYNLQLLTKSENSSKGNRFYV